MANTYKNIVITPNIGSSVDDPKIIFSGGDATTNTDVTLKVYPTSNGTISVEGSVGQLFSITNDLTNTIFSVNDVSGIPSIEVNANGRVDIARFGGNVFIGTSTGNTTISSNLVVGSTTVINTAGYWIGQSIGGVSSVGGTGSVNGITLSGTVTASGNLTLGGTLSNVSLSTQVTGTLPIANGGTGQTTQQAALNALAGATTTAQFLRGNGTNVVMSAIQASDVPTLNQNTTGTASNVTGTVAVANGGTGSTTQFGARTGLGATTLGSNLFTISNPSAITFPRFNADNSVSSLSAADFRTAIGAGTGNGTVTSVSGTGTVSGLTLSGTVTSTGSLTLGGTLSLSSGQVTGALGYTPYNSTNPSGYLSSVSLTSNVTGTLPVGNGGTGVTSSTGSTAVVLSTAPVITGLREKSAAIAASNIDLNTGNYFTRTISGATTFTVSNVSSSGDVSAFILVLTNGGSATITWFSGVTWNNATPPALSASGTDILGFFTINGGTTWRGLLLGKAMA